MRPIYLTIAGQPLMLVPDTMAHLNGHFVLTKTYHIYKQSLVIQNKEIFAHEEKLNLDKSNDENYMGYITFEIPNKLFNYVADGYHRLNGGEVEQLIEYLSHYRDNPSVWPQ